MKRPILLIALAALSACQPPAVARAPAGAVGQPPTVALPEPGAYVLKQVRGSPVPAELKRRGSNYDRILAGWLYLTPDRDYQTIICADAVDSAGRVRPDPSDRGLGGKGNKYWASGGRVYFSAPIADGGLDSIAVRVRPDTVEVVGNVFTRDRASVLPPYPPIAAFVCRAVRASAAQRPSPGP